MCSRDLATCVFGPVETIGRERPAARTWLGGGMATTSLIDQLTEVAADLIQDARKDAKPILKEGKRLAAAKAKKEKQAKKAEAGVKPKKKHRMRKLLMLALVAAAGVVVTKKVTAGEPGWQSADVEPPAPPDPGKHAAPVTEESHEADDAAGATPDEALADAAEEPHDVTTPDDPAEVVELEVESVDEDSKA
jgi:hypothetical protein